VKLEIILLKNKYGYPDTLYFTAIDLLLQKILKTAKWVTVGQEKELLLRQVARYLAVLYSLSTYRIICTQTRKSYANLTDRLHHCSVKKLSTADEQIKHVQFQTISRCVYVFIN